MTQVNKGKYMSVCMIMIDLCLQISKQKAGQVNSVIDLRLASEPFLI